MPDSIPWWIKPLLGLMNIVILAVVIGIVFLIKDSQAEDILIGAIVANATCTIQYYFGSSHSQNGGGNSGGSH